MIVCITGVPGSGKSYKAISIINELLKDANNVIFSNIDNFRFERWKLFYQYHNKKFADNPFLKLEYGSYIDISNYLKRFGSSWFSFENMKKFLKTFIDDGKKIFFFIDECQLYFDKYFKDVDVIYFFDYHRHLGIDIYLITQAIHKISPAISALCEYEIRAVPRSLRFNNMFVYKKIINNDIVGREVLKVRKELFTLYSSFVASSNENVQTPMLFFIIPLFFVVSIISFIYFFSRFV